MHVLEAAAVEYLTEIRNQRAQSNSTDELSYRDYLGKFLRRCAADLHRPANFTGEPTKSAYGRPDYEVTDGLRVVGYVEAEALGAPLTGLTGHAKEQNDRFKANLYNFVLTNHSEFRLFVDGRERAVARLPEPPEIGKPAAPASSLDELQCLLEAFLDTTTPAATTPEAIAQQLARRARLLRVAAQEMLVYAESPLHSLWALYKQTLFDGIERDKFADVYAQTFTYGLFLAWLNHTGAGFDREAALHALPRAVPAVRVLLRFGGGDELPEEFRWIVDGICSDLAAADKEAATKHGAGIGDPLVHFYETFLAAYDPALRERCGVYYTPDPVVDFIVRAVDALLRRDFEKAEGLADASVRLLDPATGTATFIARAYRQVFDSMRESGDAGVWPDRAREHLAKHFFGFERLPAAYTLAHVKLRQTLHDLGAGLNDDARLPVFLADTMMNRAPDESPLPGADVLSREIREAKRVRDDEEILVVLGNPPYFGKSDNPSRDAAGGLTFIGNLMQDYYRVDGQPLGERNPKWLQNDYVKFIRFAQWRVERTGRGVVAFITDNSYLDNPTFRGMRRSLMRTFDEIYLLDLHGNSKKRERAPDGSADVNVFDITQGVAIALMVRRGERGSKSADARIHHAEMFGGREEKYARLLAGDLCGVGWQELAPNAPFYLFRPQEQALRAEYEQGWSVTEVLPVHSLGLNSHRDDFAVGFRRDDLCRRVEAFRNAATDDECYGRFGLADTGSWSLRDARAAIRANANWKSDVVPCLYRPFDLRFCALNGALMDRPRLDLNRHMRMPNLSLVTTRQTREPFAVLATDLVCGQHKIVSVYDGSYILPLWLYPDTDGLAFEDERQANLSPAFVAAVSERIGRQPTPEEVFHYIYAVLHAPTYRERYAPFLKVDFPRVPLPPDGDSFARLAELGARLVALHLLEAPELAKHGIAFPVGGSHVVKKMKAAERYVAPAGGKSGVVRLNDTERFEGVGPEAWEFRVGGYQPAHKWLDDRVGRCLTEEEITHYRRMLAAMRETARLVPEVDAAFRGMRDGGATPDGT